MYKYTLLTIAAIIISGCDSAKLSDNRGAELKFTDSVLVTVSSNAVEAGIKPLFSIDHSRLAVKEGGVLNASQVGFYTNAENNSLILKEQIRAGLDLPYRVQAYYESQSPHVIYTDSDFVKIRHGLVSAGPLQQFHEDLVRLTKGVPSSAPLGVDGLVKNYGIIQLDSELSFNKTVENLKADILAEGDTVWFQDIDYQLQAKDFGIELGKAKLLVFGGPAPGAKAMYDYPSIGLDAFAQKVLVYEENEKVFVIYNDIMKISKLHYSETAFSHRFISYRLKSTLSGSVMDNK